MAVPISQGSIEARHFLPLSLSKGMGVPVPGPRPIDLVTGQRTRPMKVFCFGMSRTGTFSLFTALTILGYHPYHMAEALMNPDVDFRCWIEALEAKYMDKTGKWERQPWGKEEFDKILGRHDSVLDVPCIQMADELLKAYPDAKIILTERPVDDWLKSVRNSVAAVIIWNWHLVAWADPYIAGPWYRFIWTTEKQIGWSTAASNDPSRARKAYADHYKHVREICPKEKTLEFRYGMGWKELCEFLEIKDVPPGDYPKVS